MLAALVATLLVPLSPGHDVSKWQGMILRSKMPTPPIVVNLGLDGCTSAGHLAWSCAFGDTIYLAPAQHDSAGVLLHELGHEVDYEVLDGSARYGFRVKIIHSPQAWSTGPHEIFATGFSLCAQYGDTLPADYETQYSYRPTPSQHRRTCTLIRRAFARYYRPAATLDSARSGT